jgi:hypothetical protein
MKVQKAEFLIFHYRARFGGLRAPLLVPPHTLVEEDSGGGDSVSKISKEALNAINKKAGKTISEGSVKKLASTVKPSTMQNEAELRKLIKQVSAMAKVPVSENTIQEIVNAVKKSGMNPSNMEALMKLMIKK